MAQKEHGAAGTGTLKANPIISNYNIYYNNNLIFEQNQGKHNPEDDNKTKNWISQSGNEYLKGEEQNIYCALKDQINKDEQETGTGLDTDEGVIRHNLIWSAFYDSAYLGKAGSLMEASNNLLYFLTFGKEYDKSIAGNVFGYEKDPCTKGHTVKEFSGRRIYNTFSEVRDDVYIAVDEMMDAAENLVTNYLQEETIYASKEGSGKIPKSQLDWYFAIHNYRTRQSAKVTYLGADIYTMKFDYVLVDYYDWEKLSLWESGYDSSLNFATSLLWELNYYGYARNYTNYGTIECEVMWSKGDSANQATVNIIRLKEAE